MVEGLGGIDSVLKSEDKLHQVAQHLDAGTVKQLLKANNVNTSNIKRTRDTP
jgi:hypothetical protein